MYTARALIITSAQIVSRSAARCRIGCRRLGVSSSFLVRPSISSRLTEYMSLKRTSTDTSGTPSPRSHLETDLSE